MYYEYFRLLLLITRTKNYQNDIMSQKYGKQMRDVILILIFINTRNYLSKVLYSKGNSQIHFIFISCLGRDFYTYNISYLESFCRQCAFWSWMGLDKLVVVVIVENRYWEKEDSDPAITNPAIRSATKQDRSSIWPQQILQNLHTTIDKKNN